MQKIEFLIKLETITTRLRTNKIVEIFRNGFNQPGTKYDYGQLKPLLFESKSQFDQIMIDPELSEFIKHIAGIEIYEEKKMSLLTNILGQAVASQILTNLTATKFYSFHSSMLDLLAVSKDLLSNEYISKSHVENLDSGVIIFKVRIDTEGLVTSKYIKMFSALEDLVKTLEKAFKIEESEPEIILLDSGSDTNVGLATKVDIAKSIFQMFKEVWDFITSLQFYRTQQKNQALIESLTIRKELLKSAEDGVITVEEAKEYIHVIKTRTDSLIGMNVLPRALSNNETKIDNNRMIEEYKMKVIEEKNGN